eukprot:m.89758 g.89758  ORF g.89758 m.89758 type:complete len:111 (+) comp36624_c0_seq4:2016-2348(+)
MKNALDELWSLASKLQKRDQDICQAYTMVDAVKESVKSKRQNIDCVFDSWYQDVEELAKSLGVTEAVPRRIPSQSHRNEEPNSAKQHYKIHVAIPPAGLAVAAAGELILR